MHLAGAVRLPTKPGRLHRGNGLSKAGHKIAAVVLAAGKGTRMKSETAKVLHEVAGRPIAFFPIRAALALDASPVVVVVGHQGEAVAESLSRQFTGAPLRFAVQPEQLGTGHAVLCAEETLRGFEGDVLVLAADVPLIRSETLQKLVRAREGADVALLTCRAHKPQGYGRVVRNPDGTVAPVVEKDASPARADRRGQRQHLPGDVALPGAARGGPRQRAIRVLSDGYRRERPGGGGRGGGDGSGQGIEQNRAQLAASAALLRERRDARTDEGRRDAG